MRMWEFGSIYRDLGRPLNGLNISAAVLPKSSNPRPVGKLLYAKLPLPAWITKEDTGSLQRGAQSSTAGVLSSTSGSTRLTHGWNCVT
jgi:hypothetical protein